MTGFESPDPVYWVQQGYAVLQADVSWHAQIGREGNAGVLRQWDAEDYFDLIEWTASQPWCTGRVGLIGVSYLTMSQWYVAALKPPHLCAMVPWEGVTDLYRELAFHGGIPETRFVPVWSMRLKLGRNRRFPPAEDFLAETEAHPLDDACWAMKRAVLENIEVQALVCANWSDHGLHTIFTGGPYESSLAVNRDSAPLFAPWKKRPQSRGESCSFGLGNESASTPSKLA